jgi:inner membrane transporter RhtA
MARFRPSTSEVASDTARADQPDLHAVHHAAVSSAHPAGRQVWTGVALVGIGIVSVQVGAAIAKTLFPQLGPIGVVWLRLLIAGIILAVTLPAAFSRVRQAWAIVIVFGLTLAAMNLFFYLSIDRIPLGVAVTVEFLGPLAVAIFAARRAVDRLWAIPAGAGVALLGLRPADLDVGGLLFALLAGACWGAYILLSARVGRRISGTGGLAAALLVGAAAVTPIGVASVSTLYEQPSLVLGCIAVAVLSSTLPYTVELSALRRIPPALFGVLMSMEPAAAAAAGALVLDETLRAAEWAALVLVAAASIGAASSSARQPRHD